MSITASDRDIRASKWTGNWSLLRDVEIICAVIVERKTTGAAERLGISQPAVSRAIAKIEERLGRSLFHREAGRLVPTAHALALYERSGRIFEALSSLEAIETGEARQTLSILAPPTIAALFFERQVAAFAKAHPELRISFDIVTLQDLPSAIAEHRGDLGLLDADITHAGTILEPFIETAAVCLMPAGHPLAGRRSVRPSDLAGQDYVGIKRRHTLRGALDRIFTEANAHPRFVIETDAALSARNFVASGLGVSVLNPFPLLIDAPADLVARPFEPTIQFRTRFILPADAPPAAPARQFIDFIKEQRVAVLNALARFS